MKDRKQNADDKMRLLLFSTELHNQKQPNTKQF
jgi:hypothetical protein